MARRATRGDRVIQFIETYCRIPGGEHVGEPMKLELFQKKFIRAVYDNSAGTRRGYLSIGRKNGKTGLIAGILLAHLVGPEAQMNAQIVSGAMSRDQAAIVFDLASTMISLSPELMAVTRVVPSRKQLFGLPMGTEYRALSAEGKTAHGLSPVLAILDEVGQVSGPRSDFVDAVVTSQGAHAAPLLLAISTQAASDSSLFSVWLDDAAASSDPRIVSHLYSAPNGCDLLDRSAWKAANPALGRFRSLADLREQLERANRMPSEESTARNLLLNQRVSTISAFISPDTWKQNGGVVLPFGDTPVWGGLDLSKRTDLTAMVLIGKVNGIWQTVVHAWTPEVGLEDRAKRDRAPYDVWVRQGYLHTTPGATVDLEVVVQDIAAITSELNLQVIAYDRWRMDVFQKELDRAEIELPMAPWGQGFKDMTPALEALEDELLNHRVAHGGHPVLTMAAASACVSSDPAGGRKLDKARSTARIDPLQAMAQAFGVMAARTQIEQQREPEYQLF